MGRKRKSWFTVAELNKEGFLAKLGVSPATVYRRMQGQSKPKLRSRRFPERHPHCKPGNDPLYVNKTDLIWNWVVSRRQDLVRARQTEVWETHGGNSKLYRLNKLDAEHPEYAQAWADGLFQSVKAATEAAKEKAPIPENEDLKELIDQRWNF